jgi:hypothetical protein
MAGEKRCPMASIRARTDGGNNGTYQLLGDYDAFFITTAPSAG